jgi:hypothetical protein
VAAYEVAYGVEHRRNRLELESELGPATAATQRHAATDRADLDRLERLVVGSEPGPRYGEVGGHAPIVCGTGHRW